MLANQALRKLQLLAARKEAQIMGALQAALSGIDPTAQPLSVEQALVSRTVVKKLWEFLPDEHLSYQFGSIQELQQTGQRLFQDKLETPIILHCGWDVLAMATTLQAAWETLTTYYKINTDTYNTCIYPTSLDWYVIRAGTNLYPMDCHSGETATLMNLETTIPSN